MMIRIRYYHNKRRPEDMAEKEIQDRLTHLSVVLAEAIKAKSEAHIVMLECGPV
jgi:hypothetical protein